MASRFDLPTVYATLVGKVTEIITDVKAANISSDLSYLAWDARMDLNNELPNTDLIGIADWGFEEASHMPEIDCLILLSVKNDANLFREVEIGNIIRNKCVHPLKPEYLTWTVKDDTGEAFSQMTVTNFSMLPSGQSEARTVRQYGISLKRADYAK